MAFNCFYCNRYVGCCLCIVSYGEASNSKRNMHQNRRQISEHSHSLRFTAALRTPPATSRALQSLECLTFNYAVSARCLDVGERPHNLMSVGAIERDCDCHAFARYCHVAMIA